MNNGRSRCGPLAFGLRVLEIFVAVGETGSMTEAGRKLGLTQSAVSQAVRQLERDAGSALLDRRRRPLRLTPVGQVLSRSACQLLADAERLGSTVREAADAALPHIRIGLTDSFAATVGPALIKALRGYVEQLSVWSGISTTLGEGLAERKLDLVVTGDPLDRIASLERCRIAREPYLLILPTRMARAMPDAGLAELARNHALIRYSARSATGIEIDRYLERLRIGAPRRLEFDGSEVVFSMVSAGIGWAITTPLCLLQGRTHLSGVTARALPGPVLSRQLHLVWRRGELADLPARIAGLSGEVLTGYAADEFRRLAPGIEACIAVG